MEIRAAIVIPHFDNHATIGEVVQGCLNACGLPVIVVDDGSQPSVNLVGVHPTKEAVGTPVDADPGRVSILRLERNYGKGVALRHGFQHALSRGFTHALVIDADGQHSPEDIPKFIAAMEVHPFALISGVRDFDQASIPGRSKFGRLNSNFWVWYHTGYHMRDSQSGFRVYPLFGCSTITCHSDRYAFEVEYAVRWLWKFKVEPVTVDVSVVYAANTVSHFLKYKDNIRASLMHARLAAETFFLPAWMFRRAWQSLVARDRRPWTGKLRGGRLGNGFLRLMARNLPRAFLEIVLMVFVVPYFLLAARRARQGLAEFRCQLDTSRPTTFSPRRRLKQDYLHFLAFASTLVDRLYASQNRLPVTHVDEREAEDTVHLFRQESAGGIIVSAHFGCLDIVSQAYAAWEGQRTIIPMEYDAHDGLSAAQVLGKQVRRIELFDVRKRILETSELFCFLPDRPVQSQIEAVKFLEGLIFIDAVPFRLALMCQCPLLAMVAVKTGPNTYKSISKRLDPLLRDGATEDCLQLLMREYAKFLEQVVVRYPESWFNFYRYFSQLPCSPRGPLWPMIRGRATWANQALHNSGKTQWKQTSNHQEHRV